MATRTVFLSSTGRDLAAHREAVYGAIEGLDGFHCVRMEDFGARDWAADDFCRAKVAESDVFVGIVGHLYGSCPPGRDQSFTEREYDAAVSGNKPRLMFIAPEDFPLPANLVESDEKRAKQAGFRVHVSDERIRDIFNSPDELARKVVQAIVIWEREHAPQRRPTEKKRVDPQGSQEIARYCRAAESQHATLELAGFKTRLRMSIDLEALYVPLHAMVDLRAVGGSEFADAADAEKRLRAADAARDIPLVEAFREAQQRKRRGLVILGDPGSGKTTHLKRLLLWCLREGTSGLGLEPDVLPVFLPLRDLRDLSQGLNAFIEQELDSPHLRMTKGFGARLLERGRLLLLFDGLDEVADTKQRAQVARWMRDAVRARPTCIPVVTCRFAGYGNDAQLGEEFLELHLRPLTREQSEAFIRNWYRIVETGIAKDPAQGEVLARTRAAELIARLREPGFRTARLVEMTRNPLLLANLCLVHRDRGALPRGRAKLYDECIDVLLERWREGKPLRDGKRLAVGVTAEDGRRVLQPAALWLHEKDERVRATAEEIEPVLEPALKAVQWKGGAREFLRTVRDESGLLTGWGWEQYGLMHLGFQEFLAAREIRRRALEGDARALRDLAARYGQSWWQEVILILLALGDPSLFAPFMREVVTRPAFAQAPELLDLILEEAAEVSPVPFAELAGARPGRDEDLWQRQLLALRVLERMNSESIEELATRLARHPSPEVQRWLRDRSAAVARAAAQERIVTENGGVELVRVPGGTFLMGSPKTEKGRFDHEGPQHEVAVPSFCMGRYPVTNEEYARFLEANPDVQEPAYWNDRNYNQARQPVVGVTWEEARRFAEWAGGRLPSEAEWEYAARAGTTAPYLEGVSEADLDRVAWYAKNSGDRTHPVGEKGANAWGLHDVLGNVWEWVEDDWHNNYQGAPTNGSAWVDKRGGNLRAIRGGSFLSGPDTLRAAYRIGNHPDDRYDVIGFRCAQDPHKQ